MRLNQKSISYRVSFLLLSLVCMTGFSASPVWTITPVSPYGTHFSIANGQTGIVKYKVTNQSPKVHTLYLTPTQGITQQVGSGNCASPFILGSMQSCILTLSVNGSQLNGNLEGGPVICEMNNPLQCYQPELANILTITKTTNFKTIPISVSPTTITLQVNSVSPVNVTVTNNSGNLTAHNIVATLPASWADVTQDASNCATVLPGQTCTISFTAGGSLHPLTTFPIEGTDTLQTLLSASVVSVTLSLGASTTVVEVESSPQTSLTVTNTGTTFPALNVHAVLPASWTSVTQDASDCTTIAPSASCTLLFSTTDAYVAQGNIPVTGDNIPAPPTFAMAFSVDGFLVFDVPSAGNATIVDTSDIVQSSPLAVVFPWYTLISYPNPSNIAASFTNGAANTGELTNASSNFSAAFQCSQSTSGGSYTQIWYLPAVCQMASSSSATCSGTPFPNLMDNLVQLGFSAGLTGIHWSSTSRGGDPILNAYYQDFTSGSPGFNFINTTYAVRCVREIAW